MIFNRAYQKSNISLHTFVIVNVLDLIKEIVYVTFSLSLSPSLSLSLSLSLHVDFTPPGERCWSEGQGTRLTVHVKYSVLMFGRNIYCLLSVAYDD